MRVFTVPEKDRLLEYLFKALGDMTKTRVRQCLKSRSVLVNGQPITQFDHALKPGDKVSVLSLKELRPEAAPQGGIEVVFEDDTIIVINKPAGLLTIATEKEATRTAFYLTNEYVREAAAAKKDRRGSQFVRGKQLFIVHRLDREASGLLVFAKNLEAKLALQSNWKDFRKKYYAVVEGVPEKPSGTISSFLRENKFLKVYSSKRAEDAKLSTTHYRVLRSSAQHALLEVTLETGRKHQIRVHLSEMGHPIAGDDRYGSKTAPGGRLMLHAYYLALKHPVIGEEKVFQTPLPAPFESVLEKDPGV